MKILKKILTNYFHIVFCFLFGISLSNEFDSSALENCVRFDVEVDRKVYFGGENLYLLFNVEIDDGFHIYSVHPEKSLSPTYVDIIDSVYFSVVGIINEPEPLKKFDKNFNQDIYYHKNNIRLVKNLKLSDSLENNKYKVNGIFEYYACDESMCIPRWDDFSFEFQVFDGEKREDFDWEPFPTKYVSDIPLTELSFLFSKILFFIFLSRNSKFLFELSLFI